MSLITRQDSNGVKPLLQVGEFGYDNYPAGGDVGRVYIGTGTENIQIAKRVDIANYAYSKAEVDSLVVEGIVDDATISLTTAWSSAKVNTELANLDISPLLKPVITSPVNGAIDFIGNVTATYSTSESYAGVQDWVRWEASTNSDFTTLVDSYEGSSNLTSWVPMIGLALTDIYVRTRQGSDGHRSKYSDAVKFTTPDVYIIAPTLIVPGAPNSVTLTPMLTGSAFGVYNGADTHISTDWQILKASDNSIVWESLANTVYKTSIVTGTLPKDTDLIFRVRYNSSVYGSSDWVTVNAKTLDIYVKDPILTVAGAPDGLTLSPALSASAFVVVNGTANHVSTDWEIRKVSDNSVAWSSIGDTVNKTSITASGLDVLTQYKVRVKYNSDLYGSSNWIEVTGTTVNIYVVTPTLTVQGHPLDIGKNPSLTTSAFTIYNGSGTHLSTDYQILKNSDGSLVWESLGNTVDKLTINSGALVESTEYRFRARHNSTNYGSSAWVEVIGTTKDVFSVIYGVNWNPTTDTYERTGIASSAPLSTSYPGIIQTQMRRCVLNTDGTVKYFLDPNNSTKKEDGTTAIIDGTDGNVMVQIPKFWYKYEFADGKHKWLISDGEQPGFEVHPAFDRGGTIRDFRYYPAYQGFTLSGNLISGSGRVPTANKTRAVFRTEAAANGTGWSQIDWNLLIAVQLLYLTEYADFDTQDMLGQGITSGSTYTAVTGSSNSLGNASSPRTNTNTQFMSYRGIENWYGQIFKFIDGVNIKDREYFVNKKPSTYADDVFTGDYVTTGMTMAAANGYVKNIVQTKNGFISSDATGTNSTYIPDFQYQATTGNRIVFFGGTAGNGLAAGGFCVGGDSAASSAHAAIGSAVSY